MAVRVLEITGVAAPACFLGRFHDRRSGFFRLLHHNVDLRTGGEVVSERELGRAGVAHGNSRIVRYTFARPEREPRSTLQIEEGHCAMFELLADNAFGFKT